MVQNVHSNRTSADITQDTRFKCKHEKLMKSVNVHKNIKSRFTTLEFNEKEKKNKFYMYHKRMN